MAVNKTRLGATGSSAEDLGNMGALTPILGRLAGGSKGGQMAIDFAQQMYPDPPKADPYEAALQFFLAMGQGASQPGATVLGSAVGAMQAPADYLAAKKKEKRETDRARMQTALQLAPSLKPGAGKVTYRPATKEELAQYGATAGQMSSSGQFIDLSKTTGTGSTSTVSVDPANLETLRTFLGLPNLTPDENNNVVLSNANVVKASNQGLVNPKQTSKGESGSRMDVIDITKTDDPSTPIDDRITSINRDDYDETKHAPLSALPPSETEKADPLVDVLDTSIEDDPTTPRNEQRKTIKRSEFDAAKHVQLSAIPDEDLGAKDRLQAERDFRTEYTKRTESLTEARRNFQVINSSMEADSAAGDIALVTSFMKMLDPGSVVRETEFANARDTAGLLQKLENLLVEKPQTGKFLTPDQRKNFVDLAQQYLYAAQNQNTRVRQSLGTSVSQYNLNPIAIFGYEVAPPAAHLNAELVRVAIKNNTTVDALWAVMSDEEKEQYGG